MHISWSPYLMPITIAKIGYGCVNLWKALSFFALGWWWTVLERFEHQNVCRWKHSDSIYWESPIKVTEMMLQMDWETQDGLIQSSLTKARKWFLIRVEKSLHCVNRGYQLAIIGEANYSPLCDSIFCVSDLNSISKVDQKSLGTCLSELKQG